MSFIECDLHSREGPPQFLAGVDPTETLSCVCKLMLAARRVCYPHLIQGNPTSSSRHLDRLSAALLLLPIPLVQVLLLLKRSLLPENVQAKVNSEVQFILSMKGMF